MSQEVHRVLSARARRASRRPAAASLGAAFLLHALAIVLALILPRLQPRPEPLQFVPVEVIPAQALGVRRPAPPKRKPVQEEAPPAAEPEPEPPKQEEPEEVAPPPEPADDVPVLPKKEEPKKPEPKPQEQKPAPDTRPGVAPGETGDQLGRRGGAEGSPLGTTAFGSRIGVDNPEFTYGYYLDRLLSLIDAQWQRPNMGEVKAVVHFQIEKDGSITDLRVAESSGYNSFDFAALRAVQSAAPFPPLPRGYKNDSLGVNLIVY
ncbi:MAG TPA: TonB family protein [Thermoanaerobaculia bacterium]|nr:TonB family protein [Thermoanaerobaculia bacterium]